MDGGRERKRREGDEMWRGGEREREERGTRCKRERTLCGRVHANWPDAAKVNELKIIWVFSQIHGCESTW